MMYVARREFTWNGTGLKPGDRISLRDATEAQRKRLETMVKAGLVRKIRSKKAGNGNQEAKE